MLLPLTQVWQRLALSRCTCSIRLPRKDNKSNNYSVIKVTTVYNGWCCCSRILNPLFCPLCDISAPSFGSQRPHRFSFPLFRDGLMLKPCVVSWGRASRQYDACSFMHTDKHEARWPVRSLWKEPRVLWLKTMLVLGREGLWLAMGNTCVGVRSRAVC